MTESSDHLTKLRDALDEHDARLRAAIEQASRNLRQLERKVLNLVAHYHRTRNVQVTDPVHVWSQGLREVCRRCGAGVNDNAAGAPCPGTPRTPSTADWVAENPDDLLTLGPKLRAMGPALRQLRLDHGVQISDLARATDANVPMLAAIELGLEPLWDRMLGAAEATRLLGYVPAGSDLEAAAQNTLLREQVAQLKADLEASKVEVEEAKRQAGQAEADEEGQRKHDLERYRELESKFAKLGIAAARIPEQVANDAMPPGYKLVSHNQLTETGATTVYRWVMPTAVDPGRTTPAEALRGAWEHATHRDREGFAEIEALMQEINGILRASGRARDSQTSVSVIREGFAELAEIKHLILASGRTMNNLTAPEVLREALFDDGDEAMQAAGPFTAIDKLVAELAEINRILRRDTAAEDSAKAAEVSARPDAPDKLVAFMERMQALLVGPLRDELRNQQKPDRRAYGYELSTPERIVELATERIQADAREIGRLRAANRDAVAKIESAPGSGLRKRLKEAERIAGNPGELGRRQVELEKVNAQIHEATLQRNALHAAAREEAIGAAPSDVETARREAHRQNLAELRALIGGHETADSAQVLRGAIDAIARLRDYVTGSDKQALALRADYRALANAIDPNIAFAAVPLSPPNVETQQALLDKARQLVNDAHTCEQHRRQVDALDETIERMHAANLSLHARLKAAEAGQPASVITMPTISATPDARDMDRIRDLLHERRARLATRDGEACTWPELVRGLLDDLNTADLNAAHMEAKLEVAELGAARLAELDAAWAKIGYTHPLTAESLKYYPGSGRYLPLD